MSIEKIIVTAAHDVHFAHCCARVCEVCDEPIATLQSSQTNRAHYQVCSSFACRNVIEHCSTMPAHSAKLYLQLQRKLFKQRKQFKQNERERIESIEEQQRLENQAILNQTLIADTNIDAKQIQIVEIPSGLQESAPLKSERIKEYKAMLVALANKANLYKDASEVPDSELHKTLNKRLKVDQRLDESLTTKTMSEALCTMCKGGCCTSGRNTAYLSELTIRRYMDANPSQSVEDVVNQYLSYLTDAPLADSCINQTIKGCGLPRAMRSDICNGYFCDSIVAFQKRNDASDKPVSVLAIQRANTHWNRFAPDVKKHVVESHVFKAKE